MIIFTNNFLWKTKYISYLAVALVFKPKLRAFNYFVPLLCLWLRKTRVWVGSRWFINEFCVNFFYLWYYHSFFFIKLFHFPFKQNLLLKIISVGFNVSQIFPVSTLKVLLDGIINFHQPNLSGFFFRCNFLHDRSLS